NSGQIVGDFSLSIVGGGTGFLLSGGSYTPLPLPAGTSSETNAINDAGDIVGWFISGPSEAFLIRGGNLSTFAVPGSKGTTAHGINNLGMVVGTYTDAASTQHSYLLSNG